ncbi:MAG: glycosyltransferase family 2 protein [Lachnospiraceae bacterium]|nr:glycosyltransferase family 2 protein [Lachnospiraceae bacterium]
MESVSVIIPTYNRKNVIGNSIQSVLNQTYSAFELLIIDDGSTDDTESLINQIEDHRIRYIRLPENKGVSAARNVGIKEAKYDYIAFQDSDDLWKETKLEKQMQVITQNTEVGLVYCPYECRKADGQLLTVPDGSVPLEEKQGNIYKHMLLRNTIGTPTALLRKECLLKTGGFREDLTCLEDWELFLRITQRYPVAFLEEALVFANLSKDGVSHNISGYYEARCHMLATHKEALLQYGIFSDVTKEVLESAEQLGILPQVSGMLQFYLQQS